MIVTSQERSDALSVLGSSKVRDIKDSIFRILVKSNEERDYATCLGNAFCYVSKDARYVR